MSNIKLRKATTDDAVLLARLARETFLSTYEAFNEPRNIQEYVARAFTPAQIGQELKDSDSAFFVAERDASLIGYIKIRPAASLENVPETGALELERIYVAKAHAGNGIGRMLLDAAVAETIRREHGYLWLGVWKDNPEAVAFYRKCGFQIVGQKVFMMGSEAQEDHIMLLTIAHVYDVDAIRQRLNKLN